MCCGLCGLCLQDNSGTEKYSSVKGRRRETSIAIAAGVTSDMSSRPNLAAISGKRQKVPQHSHTFTEQNLVR